MGMLIIIKCLKPGRLIAKNFYTDERLLARGLSDRQVQAVRYVREQGVITNKAYRELTGVIDRTALRDLNDLCTRGIFSKRDKKGRATEYVLVKKNPDISTRLSYSPIFEASVGERVFFSGYSLT